nr:retrovirus-related Pol polyprotein from transposon TNT 1-94 [Tanacetum cinerariifolium]
FTFPIDFVIVDYESDPRVPLILGRPFLRIARALIDVYIEELILRDSDERLILNMKHDTLSYSNNTQRESIHMIDIYNISYEGYLKDLFANKKITNHLSGNPTFSSEPNTLTFDLTSPKVKDDIFDPEGDIVLIQKLLNLDSTKYLPPSHNINPLSGSTTSSSPSLTTSEISDYSLKEFADELALIDSFLSRNDDMTSEDVIKEIEYLLNCNPLAEYSLNNDLIYTILEMFTDEHTLDYLSLLRYDDTNDDLFDLMTDNDEWVKVVYDDLFDSKEDKIKESKLLIDELDPPRSSDFLPSPESDSILYEDFSVVDTLTLIDNGDKVFNSGIFVHENLYEVTNRVTPDKNVKNISSSNASLILEDYNPPLSDHELPFHIEIPGSGTLLSFSSKNEEKVFNPGILISKGVHSLLSELSHRDSKGLKVINIFESPMEIFPCSYGEDIHNGVAERRNRTLIEAARTMLADAKLPVTFWAEAVNTACYVQNRVLVNKSQNKTPYELFNGRTPAIGFLKPFGCYVLILNTLDNLGKFEAKGDEGYFIGYSMSNKAFRVFNKRTRRVEENLHVEFLENKAIDKGPGPNWLFDIDSLTKSMNYVPVDAVSLMMKVALKFLKAVEVDNILSLINRFEDILGVTTSLDEAIGVEALIQSQTLKQRINSQLQPRWGFDPGKLLYYVPNTLSEYIILSGADNRPPMLDKDLYFEYWKAGLAVVVYDSGFAIPVFSPRDDLIACLNNAMVFLTVVASSRVKDICLGNALSLSDQGMQHGQAQTIVPHYAAFQTKDLDTYDSDCDDLSNAQAVLMANISNYGPDVITEVANSETYLNDMDNQSVHGLQDFEQSPVMDFTDNEISSDSNIIPYSQYLQET